MKKLLQIMMLALVATGLTISANGRTAVKAASIKTDKSNSAVMTYSVMNNTKANVGLIFFPAVSTGSEAVASPLTGTSTVTTVPNAIIQVAPMTTSNVVVAGTPVTFQAGVVNSKTGALQTPSTTTIAADTSFTIASKSGKTGGKGKASQLVITGSVPA